MAANSNSLSLSWRDVLGNVAKVVILVGAAVLDPTASTVTTLRAAYAAICIALGYRATIGVPADVADTPTDSAYEDTQDKAVMTFRDSNGRFRNFKVPAPKPAIFLTDKITVDLANGDVTAYASAVTDNCVTAAGAAITSLVHGRRTRIYAQGK